MSEDCLNTIKKIICSFEFPEKHPKMCLTENIIKIIGEEEYFSIIFTNHCYLLNIHYENINKADKQYRLFGIFELAECIRQNYFDIVDPIHIV